MTQRFLFILLFCIGIFFPISDSIECYAPQKICAQRRSRPGSMRHSDAEIENVLKEKEVKIPAIKNGAYYSGDLFYTTEGRKVQIGKVKLYIYASTYKIDVDLTSSQIRTLFKNIFGQVKYTTDTKMGDNFSYKGKYATLEQSGKRFLRLYNDTKSEVFADLFTADNTGSILKLNLEDGFIATLESK